MAQKTWNEKLNKSNCLPEVKILDNEYAQKMGGSKMLIASAIEYDAIMKKIPEGKLITVDRIREYLALSHNADFTCPLTAGIFINVVANASKERTGDNPTPYWRTIKKDGQLCEKFPEGLEGHKLLLEQEGFKVVKKGKKYYVDNYLSYIYDLGD